MCIGDVASRPTMLLLQQLHLLYYSAYAYSTCKYNQRHYKGGDTSLKKSLIEMHGETSYAKMAVGVRRRLFRCRCSNHVAGDAVTHLATLGIYF